MNWTIIILRVTLGIIFLSHGLARLYYSSVADFGSFISSFGFPFGNLLAWIITIGEIIGSMLLISGFFVRYCIPFHCIVLLMGIFMVHLNEGWFVVGHGRNGVEYSILLLVCLIVLFKTHRT